MSNVIKSSNIIGVYKLKDKKINKKETESSKLEKDIQEKNVQVDDLEINKVLLEAEEEARKIKDTAREEAGRIIAEAREKAEEILKEAEESGQKIREEAREKAFQEGYQAGFETGEEKGYQEGLDRIAAARNTMEEIVSSLKTEIENDLEGLSGDLIKLAVKIASRIVNTYLEIEPFIINNIIREMVKDIYNIEKVSIYVNPDLLEYIEEAELKNNLSRQEVSFKGDNRLAIGDCIVETETGGRDGSLETRLEIMERELLKGAGFHEKA